MARRSLIVVALGGNAISLPDQEGNVDEQFANSRVTARALADLVEEGHQLVITHGNGPQIGNFLLRNEAAAEVIYPLPMEVAVAHVQGGMGYMIAQTLMNELSGRGNESVVTTIVTNVLVDLDDPAFANPTKPVGRVLPKDLAERYAALEKDWTIREIGPGKFRRYVPSPLPRRIMEIESIRRAVDVGDLLVVCGGGGIPIVRDPKKGYHGMQAVIDKDLVSALLATDLQADTMLILTNVDRICINYGKPDERPIDRMTVDQAKRWLDEGQFPAGSMGPKIQGAINFLERCQGHDARVIVGPLDKAGDAVAGHTGTQIIRSSVPRV